MIPCNQFQRKFFLLCDLRQKKLFCILSPVELYIVSIYSFKILKRMQKKKTQEMEIYSQIWFFHKI